MINKTNLKSTLFLFFIFAANSAKANFFYDGHLYDNSGNAVAGKNIKVSIAISDLSANCIFYNEIIDAATGTDGYFKVEVGSTSATQSLALEQIFVNNPNGSPLTCSSGSLSSYTPGTTSEARRMSVAVSTNGGINYDTLGSMKINVTPMASYAASAGKLGANSASDFVLKTGIPTCSGGYFLTSDGTNISCAPAGGGGGGGTVTNVTGVAPIGVANGTSTPAISIATANASTTGALTSTDWNTFNNKLSSATAFSGDVSGTSAAISVDKIKGYALSITSPSIGQFLKYTGSVWSNSSISTSDIAGLTNNYLNTSTISLANCTTSQTMYWNSVSSAFSCQTISLGAFGSGSQTAPSVALATGNGLFSPSANNFAITTNNVERLRVDNVGNVSIGGIAPTALLHVSGNANASIPITFENTNGGMSASADVKISGGAGGMILSHTSNAYSAGLPYSSDTSVINGNGLGGLNLISTYINGGGIRFYTTTGTLLERMHLTSAGNLGIGTTTPRTKLEIIGAVISSPAISVSSTADFMGGNIQYTPSNCGPFSFYNLKDGGHYTFIVKGTASTTCSFSAYSDAGTTALTVHLPSGHGSTTFGKHTMYNLTVAGTDVYLSWFPGL